MAASPFPVNQLALFSTAIGKAPKEPLAISGLVLLPAGAGAPSSVLLDFSQDKRLQVPGIDPDEQNIIDASRFPIQGVFIDASNSGAPVSVTVVATGQTVTIAAGKQGYLPLVAADPATGARLAVIISAQVNVQTLVPIILLNTPTMAAVWDA